ncbi:TPA: molecular chaperone, partial [Escherichia coli]|nr:molecular chaperone [Escherichia coli]
KLIKILFVFFSVVLSPVCSSKSEGLSLSQTRVVFPSDRNSVSLNVRNSSQKDIWLLKGWVTDIDGNKTDKFIITPPLYRLDPSNNFQLRINAIDKNGLSENVESIFYINVMAIPSESDKNTGAGVNGSMSFSINSRIKLLYRPQEINNKKNVFDAYKKITVTQRDGFVIISNPSPYYITLDDTRIDGKPVQSSADDFLLPPNGTISVRYTKKASHLDYKIIDDFGGRSDDFRMTF